MKGFFMCMMKETISQDLDFTILQLQQKLQCIWLGCQTVMMLADLDLTSLGLC